MDGDGEVSWGAGDLIEGDVSQRSFVIHRPDGPVPGSVWTPASRSGPGPWSCWGTAAAATVAVPVLRRWPPD